MQFSVPAQFLYPSMPRSGRQDAFSTTCKQLQCCGISGVELSAADLERNTVRSILQSLQSASLFVSGYCAVLPFPETESRQPYSVLAAALSEIRNAAALNCPNILFHFVPAGGSFPLPRHSMETLVPVLQQVSAAAIEQGLVPMIENEPNSFLPMGREQEIRRILNEVEGLRLSFNVGNALLMNEEPVLFYDHLSEKVSYIRLRDVCYLPNGSLAACRIGDGDVDFRTLFNHLQKTGYTGSLSLLLLRELTPSQNVAYLSDTLLLLAKLLP